MTSEASKPSRFGWMKPPKGGPDGTMSLMDHLRELRYRVTMSFVAIVIAAIISGAFYNKLILFVTGPFDLVKSAVLESTGGSAEVLLTAQNVMSPFTLAVISCFVAGVLFASPIWLYQVWAFFAPALLRNEKRYVLTFVGAATPLFVSGLLLGYWVWPRAAAIMIGFTPQGFDIKNLLDMTDFLKKQLAIMIIFGISFMLPLLLVMLNLGGIVHGYQLGRYRKGVFLGSVVLAAIITPTPDAFTLLALVLPVMGLYLVAEIICRIIDKRRGTTEEALAEFSPDVEEQEA